MRRSTLFIVPLFLLAGFVLGFFPMQEVLAHDVFPTITDSTRTVSTTHVHNDSGCAQYNLYHKNYFNDVSSSEVDYKRATVRPVITSGTVYGSYVKVGNYYNQGMRSSYWELSVPLISGHTYSTPYWNFDIETGSNNYVMTTVRTYSNTTGCAYVDYDRMLHEDEW